MRTDQLAVDKNSAVMMVSTINKKRLRITFPFCGLKADWNESEQRFFEVGIRKQENIHKNKVIDSYFHKAQGIVLDFERFDEEITKSNFF